MTLLNVADYREAAEDALPSMAFDYYASGSRGEATLRENRAAFRRLRLRHRVLRDVSDCDPGVEVLGHRLGLPVLVAPTPSPAAAPCCGGLAVDGAGGVRDVLGLLREEVVEAMTLAGCRTVAEIGPDLVVR